jgi:hypothetical protein
LQLHNQIIINYTTNGSEYDCGNDCLKDIRENEATAACCEYTLSDRSCILYYTKHTGKTYTTEQETTKKAYVVKKEDINLEHNKKAGIEYTGNPKKDGIKYTGKKGDNSYINSFMIVTKKSIQQTKCGCCIETVETNVNEPLVFL